MIPKYRKTASVLLALGLAGCGTIKTFLIDSQPPVRDIAIDGKTEDWTGHLIIIGNERVSLGLLNDRDNLYVCLLAEDDFTRSQILMQGLTVWFDPQGGKKKRLGIKYPIGLPPGERRTPGMGEDPEGPGFDKLPEKLLTELEIIRPENDAPQKLNLAEAKGIELTAVSSAGLFAYELKIPLRRTGQHPIAVGAEPGKTIGLGIETGKLDLSRMPRGRSGGVPSVGGLPPGGGMRPGAGFGQGPQMLEGPKFWIIVRLVPAEEGRPAQILFGFLP